MTTEDRKAFEEWKAYSGGDHIGVEKWCWAAWQAATARERERAANEAWRAAQWVHNTPDDIAAAIRGYQGIDRGNADDR